MLGRFISFLLVCAAVCLAQDEVERIQEAVEGFVSANQFMGSVLVARGDKIVFDKSYGSASLELDAANSPQTRFRIASLTKQFTAAAILLLEERGKLKLEDRVNQHIPDPPAAWDKITIFELLTHSSGIPEIASFPEYPKLRPFPIAPSKLMALIREKPLDFAPGARVSYSNSGYAVLGYLIEQVSGKTYEKFIEDNLLRPLQMRDSGYDSNSAILPNRAAGYVQGPAGWENAPAINMNILYAAAGMYSSTEDLLRWERGLFGGKILSTASLEKMTTAVKNNFGLGVMVESGGGHKRISHGGSIEGFSSYLIYSPEDQITVAVLGNVSWRGPGSIAEELATLVQSETAAPVSKRKQITLSPGILARYTGTYEIAANVNVYIRLEDGQLTAEVTGQKRAKMYAETGTRFFTRSNAQLDFVHDERGEVTQVSIHQFGRDRTAIRKSDTVVERTEVPLPAEVLAQYLGDYQLPGLILTITLEGDRLMGHIPGQAAFPMFAESRDRFFLRVVDAQIEFVRDGRDAVTELVLHQGPRDERGPRVAR